MGLVDGQHSTFVAIADQKNFLDFLTVLAECYLLVVMSLPWLWVGGLHKATSHLEDL